ncbi:MAG: HNH endonuclease [Myxococcales bacterium]|nr:HNH endonuclease [Myxococcales bacterium]
MTDARTLLLNSTYEPLHVISWRRAIKLLWRGKAEVVRSYDRNIRSVTLTIQMPAVVRLLRFVRRKRSQLSFSRRNIFARDRSCCQYCARRLEASALTYDHVMPRSLGGKTDWTNIVSSCVPCNRRKGGRTPEAAGMRLLAKPKRPDWLPGLVSITISLTSAPDAWRDFLYWNVGIESGD